MPDLPDIDTRSFAATCPKCHYVYPPIWEAAPAYFSRGFVECSECNTKSDLWQTALERMKGMPTFVPRWILMQLGATETSFTRTITANSYQAISLDTVGVPTDATVLHISYSPQGRAGEAPVFPLHWHGNSPQRKFGNVLPLIGQPAQMGDGTVGKECPVRISVLWVHQDKEDGWAYIVDALDALALQDNARVIVPAQSAVEVTLMPVIRELLERNSSKDYVKGFMGDKLTFGNVINVLLPFMCAQADIPTMTEDIRGAMSKLRKLRNDLVHDGKRRASITTGEAIEALAAAVFAFEYVKFARPQLLARLK